MGGGDDLRQGKQWAVHRRFFREDIKGSPCHYPLLDGPIKGSLINNPASGTVDDSHPRLHFFEGGLVQQAPGLFG